MRRYSIGGLLIVFLATGVWLYWWGNSPVKVTSPPVSPVQRDVLGSETVLLPWQTQFFETEYPDTLRSIRSNEIAHGNTAGQYLLGSVSLGQGDQLAVTIGRVDTLGLGELPAVKIRQQQTNEYERANRDYAPSGSLVFRKTSTYELAIFWQHNEQYAAVVVSGSVTRETEHEQAIAAVLTHWRWR